MILYPILVSLLVSVSTNYEQSLSMNKWSIPYTRKHPHRHPGIAAWAQSCILALEHFCTVALEHFDRIALEQFGRIGLEHFGIPALLLDLERNYTAALEQSYNFV